MRRGFAGERALKTAALLSGVFGRGSDEADATRSRFMCVDEIWTGTGGIVTGARVLARGRNPDVGTLASGEGEGLSEIVAFATASFACRFCTLRLRASTLEVSFLFSFNMLKPKSVYHIVEGKFPRLTRGHDRRFLQSLCICPATDPPSRCFALPSPEELFRGLA